MLLGVLIFAIFFAGSTVAINNSCPQPIINNYIDVNVITPPVTLDSNFFSNNDRNYSPNIIVNVEQKPLGSTGSSTTYVTNNYVTDTNTPIVYYPFHFKAIDVNGTIILDETENFSEGTEALDAMQELATIEYTQYTFGAMILSINGISASSADHEYWALYEDGNYSMVGVSEINIDSPTFLEWKLERW